MADEEEDEIARLEDLCDHFELLWRRAAEGAKTANKAVRRLQGKVATMKAALAKAEEDVSYEGGISQRLGHENEELRKKVQRLSLKILDLWSKE